MRLENAYFFSGFTVVRPIVWMGEATSIATDAVAECDDLATDAIAA
jgi:hypothetical protein